MAAAYAALVSLTNTIHNIQNHPRLSVFLGKNEIESLRQHIVFLLDFVESCNFYGGLSREEVEDFENQIASSAHEAEDVIESHMRDRILPHLIQEKDPLDLSQPSYVFGLQKVILEMDSIKKTILKVKEERGSKEQKPTNSMSGTPSRPPMAATGKTTMVGFDDVLLQLLDMLTSQQSHRQIIPVVGMGGIGKTTLARSVYENSFVVQHFYVRAWVTISHDYDVKKTLLEILACLGGLTSKEDERTKEELGEQVYKILFGRRYVIVLDDMWSIQVWDHIKPFFPENYSRSRIVVTTRGSDVASLGSVAVKVNLLDEDRSWDLFCNEAFVQECCPPELEEIGKKIVKKCKGLPLALVVIGGLLRKSSRMLEYWEKVEKEFSSVLNSREDNQCLNILFLSYSHLPTYLKPCFLYLGIFPEDEEIRISELAKIWVAEGFIKPNKTNEVQSLEEIAEDHIKDLVDRNLVFIRRLRINGKPKTFSIHDLLRDLCIKVAKKEKFFCVMKGLEGKERELDNLQDIERHVIIQETLGASRSASYAFSAIGQARLRVLSDSSSSLGTTLEQFNLRFLTTSSWEEGGYGSFYTLPSIISLFWNLQTLMFTYLKIDAPSEIWEMLQLRHFCCTELSLPDPPPLSNKQDSVVMRNLRTLTSVVNFRCTEEVYKRLPNIRKLSVVLCKDLMNVEVVPYSYYHFNLSYLNKLESLEYESFGMPSRDDLLHNLKFPSSLKRLALLGSKLHWDDLTIIGSLPYLEVLKLNSIQGTDWNPLEGEFCSLKSLEIAYGCDLVCWNADKSNFPVLEKLLLFQLYKLEEIPLGIGDIDTLGDIFLSDCTLSAGISAMRILEEQESLGNEDLQVRVRFSDKTKLDEFKKRVELEDGLIFPRNNFHLSCNF